MFIPKCSIDACCSPPDPNYINGSNIDLFSMECRYYPNEDSNEYNTTLYA